MNSTKNPFPLRIAVMDRVRLDLKFSLWTTAAGSIGKLGLLGRSLAVTFGSKNQ